MCTSTVLHYTVLWRIWGGDPARNNRRGYSTQNHTRKEPHHTYFQCCKFNCDSSCTIHVKLVYLEPSHSPGCLLRIGYVYANILVFRCIISPNSTLLTLIMVQIGLGGHQGHSSRFLLDGVRHTVLQTSRVPYQRLRARLGVSKPQISPQSCLEHSRQLAVLALHILPVVIFSQAGYDHMSYDSVSVSVARLRRLAVAVVETNLARLCKRTDRRNWRRGRREGGLVFVQSMGTCGYPYNSQEYHTSLVTK